MRKIYLITYNADIHFFGKRMFHDHINSLCRGGVITDWWHYVTDTYIVVSDLGINSIYNNIFPIIPGKGLFIVEINTKNIQGWLPQNAWDWLKKYS